MKRTKLILTLVALLGVVFTAEVHAQSTAFTYQGQLSDNGMPANGFFDIAFSVWDASSGPAQIGRTITSTAVPLSNGLFSVRLDFGKGIFAGGARWLEIGVRTNGDVGPFNTLSPRQEITSAPYAIQTATAVYSTLADSVIGNVSASQLTGTISSNNIEAGSITSAMLAGGAVGTEQLAAGTVFNGSFIGDASSLSNLDSTKLSGPLSFDPTALVNIGHIINGGTAYGVAVSGNYAFLANHTDGLRVYDISNPSSPVNIGHIDDGGYAECVAVSGNYACLANSTDGLRVYDISNPSSPVNVGHINDGGNAQAVAVSGNYAYLANYSDGLRVYDISDPANPVNVGHTNDVGNARGVAVSGNWVCLANENDGLRVYDVSDPANPNNVGHIDDNGGYAQGVAMSGNYAYLANTSDGLRVYDISDPANPVSIGHIDEGGMAYGVAVSGNHAYLANWDDGLRVYDISDPANPVNIGHIDDGGSARGVAVSGNHAYLANWDDGLRVYTRGAVTAPSFVGNGSGLTGLSAAELTRGTVPSERLSGTYSNALDLNNAGNTFNGTFIGDGAGLLGIHSLDAADGSPTNAVYVDNDGSVGIGTSAPRERLEVEGGNIRIQGVDGFDAPGESAYLYLGSKPDYVKATRNFGMTLGVLGAPDAVTLQNQTGNVGIGTTNPATALHVAGTVTADAFDGSIAASRLTGTISSSQLAAGAAAENLAANGQSAVPSGGMILAATDNDTNLLNAGYVKLGSVVLGPEEWARRANVGPAGGRYGHTAVWTGAKMIIWGGFNGLGCFNDGVCYDPAANSWTAVSTNGAPSPRYYHTAVWTGTEMIIWGGTDGGSIDPNSYFNDGARYNPVLNTWTSVTTNGAPSARALHTAVWTGSEMIIWGGSPEVDWFTLRDGGRYNPAANSWAAVTTTNSPASRENHTAVWTGKEMIVWGGYEASAIGGTYWSDGALYNPASNAWTLMASEGAPAAREGHTAVWTGTEMIVWGGADGSSPFSDGGRYDPADDTWSAVAGSALYPRWYHTAAWTGSEMVVWGGTGYGNYLNDGALYDPVADSWKGMSATGGPAARAGHTAVWTGSEMIICGGKNASGYFNDTFSYRPSRHVYLYQRL